jgi:hypothetical protein
MSNRTFRPATSVYPSVEEEWYRWLQTPCYSPYTYHTNEDGEEEDGGWCTIAEWARALLYESILPNLNKKGYVFYKNRNIILNAFLNYLFRIDGTPSGFRSGYTGRPVHTISCTRDDMDFYCTHKCPTEFWASLRKAYAIQRFADDSIFADRLWTDLPWFIFYQIDIKDSPATQDLADYMAFEDGEDSDEDYNTAARRNDIDPYLMEYGKNRHKTVGKSDGGGGSNTAGYSDQAP